VLPLVTVPTRLSSSIPYLFLPSPCEDHNPRLLQRADNLLQVIENVSADFDSVTKQLQVREHLELRETALALNESEVDEKKEEIETEEYQADEEIR
jgi:hypothetical protein